MACEITEEKYNGLNSLYSNVGEWVVATVDFYNQYSIGSGTSNKFTVNNDTITRQSGNWSDAGLVPGMVITIKFYDSTLPPPQNPVVTVKTITYINGGIMYIDSALGSYPNATFPTSGSLTGMLITSNDNPEAAEWFFNLTPNGTQTINSVIDQQINKFIYSDLNNLAEAASAPMEQENNESGGLVKDVIITRNTDQVVQLNGYTWSTVTRKKYTISYKFLQWGLLQDGFDPPSYYNANDCLAPYHLLKTFATYGNQNGLQEGENATNEGNTGYFDENYNGGASEYASNSISWLDHLGNPIDQMDYSNYSDFTAVIDAPNQNDPNSIYRIGLAWLPLDTDYYQNKPTNIGDNLLLNAPDQNYNHSGAPDPTVWNGLTSQNGARFDLTNLQFEIIGGNQVRITGRVIPENTADETINFFEQFPNGERNMVIWVQVGDYTLANQYSDQVNLLIYNEDNYDAPTLGVQYPKVVDEFLLDHAKNDITSAVFPNTTTEDDVLYLSNFLLDKNTVYDGIRARIFIRNSSTLEEATLETIFMSFDNVPYINGVHEVNETFNRGFSLPTGTDRNIISLMREVGLDTVDEYGVKLDYGFLNDWRYWIEQANIPNDFFDLLEPNNGLNKNWQRFSENGDWSIYLAYYVRLEDVDDFQEYKFKIRPYEDDPSVTTLVTFIRSDGSTPSNLVANEVIEINVKFLWTNPFISEWVEFTIEDFESGNRWVISSEYDQVNQQGSPFLPLVGETRIKLTPVGTNLIAQCLIDTSFINVNNVSLSYRVFSEPHGEEAGKGKEMTTGGFKYTTAGEIKQKA